MSATLRFSFLSPLAGQLAEQAFHRSHPGLQGLFLLLLDLQLRPQVIQQGASIPDDLVQRLNSRKSHSLRVYRADMLLVLADAKGLDKVLGHRADVAERPTVPFLIPEFNR